MFKLFFIRFKFVLPVFAVILTWNSARSEVAMISVIGRAEKSVDPNEVNINFEISSKNVQAKTSQEEVAKEYQRIKTLTEKFKIKKEDFQTIAYNLYPEYTYHEGRNRLNGYRVNHSVFVVIRKIEDAGSFLDSLVAPGKGEGYINIQSVSWGYDKREEIENALLGLAVKNAKYQADELSKAAGAKIKGVYRLSRSFREQITSPMDAKMSKVMLSDAASILPTEVSAGPIKIQVQVQADYELQ